MTSGNLELNQGFGNCEICVITEAKYKCPCCGTCTCSLLCVKTHKERTYCTGIRNRVAMLPKQDMDNFTLLSDYRFLEEIDHKLDDGLRNPLRRSIMVKETFEDLPPHLKRLKNEAKYRGTVIEFMPKHFSKHRDNSTRFNFVDRKIRWHIKWVFHQADISFVDESVDEDTLIVDLLRKYIEPFDRMEDEEISNKLTLEESEKLCYYQSASYRRIAVLFKSSLCQFDDRFIEMFPSKSLKLNLANRKVVEHPVFYVVLRDHLDAYIECKTDDSMQDILPGSIGEKREAEESSNTKLLYPESKRFCKQLPKGLKPEKKDGGINFFDAFSDDSNESS